MDIIAAIDHATGCHHCGGPLDGSPSDDFCSQTCQAAWQAARTEPLIGYREPWDLVLADYDDVPRRWVPGREIGTVDGDVLVLSAPPEDYRPLRLPDLTGLFAVVNEAWVAMADVWATIAAWGDEINWDTIRWHGLSPAEQPGPDEVVLPNALSPATFDLAATDEPTPDGVGRVEPDTLHAVWQAALPEPVTMPTAARDRALAEHRRSTGPARRPRPPRAITPRSSR